MKKPVIKKLNFEKGEKLSLTNDGKLTFFWIGIGSAFSKQLYQTNLIIIKGKDHLLVDCASRCSTALIEYGCPITNIRNYFITHSHADHIGGLEEIALMNRYLIKKKPVMVITEEYEKNLWNNSLKGGCAYNENNDGKFLEFNDFFDTIRPKEIKDKPAKLYQAKVGKIDLKLFRTIHIPDNSKTWKESAISFGIIVDDRILFTSDTRYDPGTITELIKEVPKIEFLFHDCQFFPGGVHASYKEILNYSDEIKSKMFLTHYGDNYKDFNPTDDGFLGFAKQGHYYIFE